MIYILQQHNGQHIGDDNVIGFVGGVEFQVAVVVVNFPEDGLSVVLDGSEIVFSVGIVVFGEGVEFHDLSADILNLLFSESLYARYYDNPAAGKHSTEFVIQFENLLTVFLAVFLGIFLSLVAVRISIIRFFLHGSPSLSIMFPENFYPV